MKASLIKKNLKAGFTLIELMVVIAILAVLGSIAYGPILDHMNDGDRQKARDNMKSVFTMLQQFQTEYHAFPCDATAESIQENERNKDDFVDYGDLTGNTSNCYLRQLLYMRGTSEKNFFASINCAGKLVEKEGDDALANRQALKKNENAMSYVMLKGEDGAKQAVDSSKTSAPLLICALYPSNEPVSGDKLTFDNRSFRGHVFVLSCDGQVKDFSDKQLQEDETNEEKCRFAGDTDIFPQHRRRGTSTAGNYIVLPPDL